MTTPQGQGAHLLLVDDDDDLLRLLSMRLSANGYRVTAVGSVMAVVSGWWAPPGGMLRRGLASPAT